MNSGPFVHSMNSVQKRFFFKNLIFSDIAEIEELMIFCNENITEDFIKEK